MTPLADKITTFLEKTFILTAILLFSILEYTHAQAVNTVLQSTNEGYVLMRNNTPYFIKGAGGQTNLNKLTEYGGNSIRTWGTDEDTGALLDAAHEQGLTVCMGLWVGHQAHGFNYNSETAVANQLAQFTEMVTLYKDHPAVLMWAIGNEVELGTNSGNFNPKVWDAINDISLMIHEIDGNHPTLTVTAGISVNKANQISERAPDLDIIGVNAYGGIGGVHDNLINSELNIPYIITEWGPNGQWEVPKTQWGAPIEQTSTQKANSYDERYDNHILAHENLCLGSYVFLWGEKFEQTATWYGLFFDQYETEAVAVMQEKWSGTVRANKVPKIISATINEQSASQNAIIDQETENLINVDVEDENEESLTYQYIVQPEQGNNSLITSEEYLLPYLPDFISDEDANQAFLNVGPNYENYRLFIFVIDDADQIAMANIPFRVDLAPLTSTDPSLQYPVKDAYIQGGASESEPLGIEDPLRLLTRKGSSESTNRKSILSFDLSLAEELSSTITLSIYGGNSTDIHTMVSGVSTTYDEETVTFNNLVRNEIEPLDTVLLDGNTRYHEWNVTNYVNRMVADGASEVHFLLENIEDSPSPTVWESREVRINTPMLEFNFDGRAPILLSNKKDFEENGISLYPNPATDLLNISTNNNQQINKMELIGYQGSIIQFIQKDNPNSSYSIDISALPDGLYYLRVWHKNGLPTIQKFVKK